MSFSYFSFFLSMDPKEIGWREVERVGRSRNISLGGENMKGPEKKSNVSQRGFNTAAYPTGSRGGSGGRWELFLIRWYGFIISLSPEQVAGWLTGQLGAIAGADGANGIGMPGPHLSVVMAWWQELMDRWGWRLAWQSRSADELWNETDIQKLWAAQTWTDPRTPTLLGQPVCSVRRVSATTLTSIFRPCGSAGRHGDTLPSLGTWPSFEVF